MIRAGSSRFPIPGGAYYCWMIHTHPDHQNFLIDMMEEGTASYAAAWIHWRAGKRLKAANWRTLFTNAPVPTPDGYGPSRKIFLPDSRPARTIF